MTRKPHRKKPRKPKKLPKPSAWRLKKNVVALIKQALKMYKSYDSIIEAISKCATTQTYAREWEHLRKSALKEYGYRYHSTPRRVSVANRTDLEAMHKKGNFQGYSLLKLLAFKRQLHVIVNNRQ